MSWRSSSCGKPTGGRSSARRAAAWSSTAVGWRGGGGHAILVEKVGLGRAKGSGLFSKRVPVSICVCDPIFGAHRVAISGTKTPVFRPTGGTAGMFKKEMVVV